MNQIDILLSTYNGEKYLKELLNSILNQTVDIWRLLIRDDGSIDNTSNIINNYIKSYPNKISLINSTENVGVVKSFNKLLENSTAPYIMFCDQDDVWLPFKIENTFTKMLENEIKYPNKPILVHTDLCVVDHKLKTIADSFWYYSRIKPEFLVTFNYLAVHNAATGCTIMINDKARTVIPSVTENTVMHDTWYSLNVANKAGVISYVKKPTILYRQHGNNVLGAKNQVKYYLKNKIRSLKEVLAMNIKQFKMVNEIRSFPIYKYFYYKLAYLIKNRI